ncbi:MAG: hypothetical protein OEX21_06525 [Betaproteobacteria bacterium]|nr:hypothetical protein [Betaproteobacteria bacterium]
MFIGHFGAGFGAKALAPRVSLGWLFAAAQFIDLLWPALLLAGVERVRIAPGATAVTPLVFEHYPVSHSLAAVLGWSLLVAGAYFALRRGRRGAIVLAGLVAFLIAIHAGNLLGPPPPSVAAIAWVGQAQWLLVLWAYWVDGHRRAAAA